MSRSATLQFLCQLSFDSYKTLSKGYKIRLIVGLLILIVGCSSSAIVQLIFKEVVDYFIGLDSSHSLNIFFVISAYSFSWTMNQISNIIAWLLAEPVIAEISKQIIYKMFDHLLLLPYDFFLSKESLSIHSYFETVFRTSSAILSNLFIYIIPALLEMTIIFIFFIKFYSVWLGGILLILLVIFFYLTYSSIQESKNFDAQYYGHLERFHGLLIESIDQIMLIKTYHAFQFQKEKMKRIMHSFFYIAKKRMWHLDKAQAFQILLCGIILLLISVLSGYAVEIERITAGDFVMINNYFIQFTIPITFLGFIFADVYREFILLKKSIFIFEIPVMKEITSTDTVEIQKFIPSVIFQNVSLSFQNKKIIDSLSFTINPQEKVAIVGTSGSGKSTCLKLITQLYQGYEGTILISEHDSRYLSKKSISEHIGVVLQHSFLFQGSIAENIAYGQKHITDEAIIEVIKKVKLYEKVKTLEKGIHTPIEGLDFSGGEKQRIAIARALLRNPEIFLFDEITASLDAETEKEIQAYIQEIVIDKTAIFVTHRLSFAALADKIIMFKKGKIIGIGSHQELLRTSPEYKNLYEKQTENES